MSKYLRRCVPSELLVTSFRAFSNLFCIRFSVMLIPVPFKTFLAIFYFALCLANVTVMGRVLSVFFLGQPSRWNLLIPTLISIFSFLTILFATYSAMTSSAFFGKPWIKIWIVVLVCRSDRIIHWLYWTYHLYMFLSSSFFLFFFCLFS